MIPLVKICSPKKKSISRDLLRQRNRPMYQPAINQVLTDYWALHQSSIWLWNECQPWLRVDQLLTDSQWIVSKVSVKYQQNIVELQAILADIHINRYINRLSSKYQSSADQLSTDISVDVSVESTYNNLIQVSYNNEQSVQNKWVITQVS